MNKIIQSEQNKLSSQTILRKLKDYFSICWYICHCFMYSKICGCVFILTCTEHFYSNIFELPAYPTNDVILLKKNPWMSDKHFHHSQYCDFYHCIRAQFYGSAYRKHRIGAYGSRTFCAYGKRFQGLAANFGFCHAY